MKQLKPFLGDIDTMLTTVGEGANTYVQPVMRNLGVVSLVLVRELIAPAAFRNADAEVTDIEYKGNVHVRAVANKFKYAERGEGLRVLRALNAGGKMPQNRTAFGDKDAPGDLYDLNTVLFGDSAMKGKRNLSSKAGALYSDAISVGDYGQSVDKTFHNRAGEEGVLFDPVKKENSVNIFDRHFVKPGTLLVQVITLNGRTVPQEAIDHLLLSIRTSGAYGGQTAVYGVNTRNHLVGAYADLFESPTASPYVLVDAVRRAGVEPTDLDGVKAELARICEAEHAASVSGEELTDRQRDLMSRLRDADPELRDGYAATAGAVSAFYNGWFEKV